MRKIGKVLLLGLALTVLAGGISGCASYKVLTITAPAEGAKVSVNPTLSWKPYKDPGVTYDVSIWEADGSSSKFPGSRKEVYYKEGIKETSHTLTEPLKPESKYLWSVRVRKGEDASSWAMRETVLILLLYNQSTVNTPTFVTGSL